MRILLFLDFDGVLHSKYSSSDNYFSNLKFFEETIKQFPNIDVIISSNWRYQYTMDELLAFFSVEFQKRIIDCTRLEGESKVKIRYDEIMDYLKHNKQLECPWIAVDDAKNEFPENPQNVVFCQPNLGFNKESALVLSKIISSLF